MILSYNLISLKIPFINFTHSLPYEPVGHLQPPLPLCCRDGKKQLLSCFKDFVSSMYFLNHIHIYKVCAEIVKCSYA